MFPLNTSKEAVSTGKEENYSSSTGITGHSKTSDFSCVNNTCLSFEPPMDGIEYKRRKVQSNTGSPVLEENTAGRSRRDSGDHCISGSVSNSLTAPNANLGRAASVVEDSNDILDSATPSIFGAHPLETPFKVLSPQIISNSNLEPVQTTQTYAGGDSPKMDVDAVGKFSSSDSTVAEHLGEFRSIKELCISVLESHGLLGEVATTSACPLEVMGVADANDSFPCKVCGFVENPSEMLICDHCEEAFHVSCSYPKMNKTPQFDEWPEWFCQSCEKNPNCLQRRCNEKTSETGHRYGFKPRIGEAFQAEVPEWSGPVSNDCIYFNEPVDQGPLPNFNSFNARKPGGVCNWLQCKEVIDKDNGIVCGKWRRAPLFESQTKKWDCSCALVWDVFHADCAVPQEVETTTVQEHLKLVEKWRYLLNKKQKSHQSRSNVPNQSRYVGSE